jgi:hypothetical protein
VICVSRSCKWACKAADGDEPFLERQDLHYLHPCNPSRLLLLSGMQMAADISRHALLMPSLKRYQRSLHDLQNCKAVVAIKNPAYNDDERVLAVNA